MIPQERVNEAAKELAKTFDKSKSSGFRREHTKAEFYDTVQDGFIEGFTAGVRFAEAEMKSVAIEFAEWCGKKRYIYYQALSTWFHQSQNDEGYTTAELFAKFEAERSGK